MEKNVFFRALPESPNPPLPLTPIRATWSFFYVKNDVLGVWKKFDAGNEGNYDDNDGNFDYNYDKND